MKLKAEVSEQINTTHSSALPFSGLSDLFCYTNLPVGLCTVAAATTTFFIAGKPVNISCLGFIFCATIFIYNAERLHAAPVDKLNSPERSVWISGNRSFLTNINLVLISICFYFLITHFSISLLCLSLLLLVSCLCYNSSLKKTPAMKNILVSTIWTVTVSIFPLVWTESLQYGFSTNYCAICFGCAFMNTILFDMRDSVGDKAYGIKSIPVILSKKLCTILFIAFSLIVILLSSLNNWLIISIIPAIYLALFFTDDSKVKYLLADLVLASPLLILI